MKLIKPWNIFPIFLFLWTSGCHRSFRYIYLLFPALPSGTHRAHPLKYHYLFSGSSTPPQPYSFPVPFFTFFLQNRQYHGLPFPGHCRPAGGKHLQRTNHLWRPAVNRKCIIQNKVDRKPGSRRRWNTH